MFFLQPSVSIECLDCRGNLIVNEQVNMILLGHDKEHPIDQCLPAYLADPFRLHNYQLWLPVFSISL